MLKKSKGTVYVSTDSDVIFKSGKQKLVTSSLIINYVTVKLEISWKFHHLFGVDGGGGVEGGACIIRITTVLTSQRSLEIGWQCHHRYTAVTANFENKLAKPSSMLLSQRPLKIGW